MIFLRQFFYHLHTIVKYSGNLNDGCTASQGLGELSGGYFSLREEDNGANDVFVEVAKVEGGGRRSIAGGGADAQELVNIFFLYEIVYEADGARHSPVLERSTWIQAIVLEIEFRSHHLFQTVICLNHRSMSLPKIDDLIKDTTLKKLMEEEGLKKVEALKRLKRTYPIYDESAEACDNSDPDAPLPYELKNRIKDKIPLILAG